MLQDPLNCLPEEIVKSAKERHHPNLNKAFLDAGMPWAQGKIGGELQELWGDGLLACSGGRAAGVGGVCGALDSLAASQGLGGAGCAVQVSHRQWLWLGLSGLAPWV